MPGEQRFAGLRIATQPLGSLPRHQRRVAIGAAVSDHPQRLCDPSGDELIVARRGWTLMKPDLAFTGHAVVRPGLVTRQQLGEAMRTLVRSPECTYSTADDALADRGFPRNSPATPRDPGADRPHPPCSSSCPPTTWRDRMHRHRHPSNASAGAHCTRECTRRCVRGDQIAAALRRSRAGGPTASAPLQGRRTA